MGEWYSFHDQMQEMFGWKVYRLFLSSGCTCPNRDGTLSSDGCIFCSAGGSGDFAADAGEDILQQMESARRVPAELIGCFNLIFYSSAEDAVFKTLGVD